jgi:mannosylglycoprotein endo-beta-mannosidase
MKASVVKKITLILIFALIALHTFGDNPYGREYLQVFTSKAVNKGAFDWKMQRADAIRTKPEILSTPAYTPDGWMDAIVPGTVLGALVHHQLYPEPYFGVNNKLEEKHIPDIYTEGRDFYTYWFRTEFETPEAIYAGKHTWLQVDGINYRAEIWINGTMAGLVAGMFHPACFDISDYITLKDKNVLAVKVVPVDVPGTVRTRQEAKGWGAQGEWQNGGNGEIGKNVSMLMTVGWDFMFHDGIRDRNTGIWKDMALFTTGDVSLRHPFIKSELSKPGYDRSGQTVSVEVANPTFDTVQVTVRGEIRGEGIRFEKSTRLLRGEVSEVIFTPAEFPQLIMERPRLWWPLNKGKQELYDLDLKVFCNGKPTDSLSSRFGIREITSSTDTPDGSRTFYVNGRPLFIKGTNWLPEAMLRDNSERTCAQLRYTAQAGINMIRQWGGGITESDEFFRLCDELGILVWQEFWMTGDTKHPVDEALYLSNMTQTIKRIRNHPSLAYYVSSNESTEVTGAKDLVFRLDGTRGYQMQSECDGIHDGSPYKQVNIMCHYENTASDRGSRIDGFNPEYGAPCLPTVECLREMMPENDLWPINKEVWDYLDGNGFHKMTTLYANMVNEYGASQSIEAFAEKAQFVGAFNYKSIWEVWNYNKLNYGDRYCSGFLFWYHNPPVRQVCARMWDWSLEPTAALYAAQNACEPLHPQFDFLKNTVSVNNDYPRAFAGYTVRAEVYDLSMKKVFSRQQTLDIPDEGVVNDIFTIEFPNNLSAVHFIALTLTDDKGNKAGSNFYWRSNSRYEGRNTLTGPTTAGFQDIHKLAQTRVKATYKTHCADGKHFIDLQLKNTGKTLSFFTQVQWLDGNGNPVRPSFYTDNFLTLMPGEERKITIETDLGHLPDSQYTLVVRGFNTPKQIFTVKTLFQ